MLVGLVAAAALSGCSDQACGAVGALDGVSVTIDQQWRTAGADSVQVCQDGRCNEARLGTDVSVPVFVEYPIRAGEQDVRLRVLAGGRVLVERTVRVAARTVQPNGPGCEPTAHQADASV